MDHIPSVKGERIGAAFIDLFLIYFVGSPFMAVSMFGAAMTVDKVNMPLVFLQLLFPLFLFLYYSFVPFLTKGSTLGKLMIGLKVVSLKYERPKFKQLILRNSLFLFSFLISLISIAASFSGLYVFPILSIFINYAGFFIILLVEFIMILAMPEERGFHDLIAKTYVIKKNFNYEALHRANAIERQNMEWAIFDDETEVKPKDDDIPILKEEDDIEILKQNKTE